MKVVVSTIMKDEPTEFIERWAKSALDADELVLVDTGSTNEAVEMARDLGITVYEIDIRPWRFDMARNAALSLIDGDVDVVVKLDVDEVLVDGWRQALEDVGPAARYSYRYVWNFTEDGEPDVEFNADHTISRHGWFWKHPVHEALTPAIRSANPGIVHVPGMTIEHRADASKPRSQYLPLLELAVEEAPDDDRMAHYYARELFFRGDWVSARREFMRHLSLPTATWPAERGQSYRYLAKMDDYPERWLLKAVGEDPSRREPWVDLTNHWFSHDQPELAAGFAARALMIRDRAGDYMSESTAWDDQRLRMIAGMT
jgi:glycosyltransferase involved in cell wall biosynthesis